MGRARDCSSFRRHIQQHREPGQFSNLFNIPEPTEIVVSVEPTDEHDEDESDPVPDDGAIDDSFHHGVSSIFPLARVTSVVEDVEEQRCCVLERNQKLLACKYGHLRCV
jgi:hypothetical protein